MKKIISMILLLSLLLSGCGKAPEAPGPLEDLSAVQVQINPEPGFGSLGGDWAVFGLSRCNAQLPQGYLDGYYDRITRFVTDCGGVLDARKYTEYSRLILALTAIGRDPRDVGGFNLLVPLGNYEQTVFQGINGAAFALLALDSGHYEIPACPEAGTQATRDLYVQHILDRECPEGGWSLAGGPAEADLTAMMLQALAPYVQDPAVQAAADRGIACLSRLQLPTGGFGSCGAESCESSAQVLIALTALGIAPDDSRFVKNGVSPEQRLLDFYTPGQGFAHVLQSHPDPMATNQAFLALVALHRFRSGDSPLYQIA